MAVTPEDLTNKTNNALSTALGTKPTRLPIPEFKPVKTSKEAYAKIAEYIPLQTEANVGIEQAKLNLDSDLAGAKYQAAQQSADDLKTKQAEIQLKKAEYPLPEFHPTQENALSLGSLFSLVSTMGVMLGSSGKMSAQNSLNAMTGMLKGWQTGRKDLYEKEAKEFDKNYKRIKDMHAELGQDLEDYYKLAPLQKEAAFAKLEEIARKAGASSIISEMRNKGNVDGIVKLYEGLGKQLNDVEIKRLEIQRQNQPSYQILTKPDGSVVIYDSKNPIATAREYGPESPEAKIFFGSQKLSAKTSVDKALKKGEFQAQAVGKIIGRAIDVDAASKVVAAVEFEDNLKDLQNSNIKLGNVPGLTVDVADKVNKFLLVTVPPDEKGERKFTRENLDQAYLALQNDKSFSALSDNSKIMAKKELNAVMSYLQTKYGNRAPVAEFRAAQTVLSRKQMTPTAYNVVVQDEIKGANDRMLGVGFQPQEIVTLKKHFATKKNELKLLTEGPSEPSATPITETSDNLTPDEKIELENLRKKLRK